MPRKEKHAAIELLRLLWTVGCSAIHVSQLALEVSQEDRLTRGGISIRYYKGRFWLIQEPEINCLCSIWGERS